MKKALRQLQQQLDGELYYDNLHKTLYATDASVYRKLPLAVAFPKHKNDIKVLCAFAKANSTHLIPRTAGTSLAGQCVGEGIVVDVSKHFTAILDVDLTNDTVTVQPGVIRDELNRYLEQYDLLFGPNTSTSNRCMIGGMVGNNSSGTTSIQYGVTRDSIHSLKMILWDGSEVIFEDLDAHQLEKKYKLNSLEGSIYRELRDMLSSDDVREEIIAQFPKKGIHRRNTGYALDSLIEMQPFNQKVPLNISRLIAGSEGTLGFITEITLHLNTLPHWDKCMIAVHFDSIESCMEAVAPIMKHNPISCEMMDRTILNCTKNNTTHAANRFFIQGDPAAVLLVEVDSPGEITPNNKAQALVQMLEENKLGYAYPILKGADINRAFELRKAGLGLLGNTVGDRKAVACIEDTAVLVEDLKDYIAEFTALMKNFNQEAVYYAHAGAGELHLRPILNLKKSEDVAFFKEITDAVATLVKKYGGSLSGEHGDGIVRSEFILKMVGKDNYDLMCRVKELFDPYNIFNAGKIINPISMDENLRYEIDRIEPKIETLLDFSQDQGILRSVEKCNGSGDCRKLPAAGGTMCPSYRATRDEKDTTRGRANTLREFLTHSNKPNKFNHQELKEVFDLCISCKACASECPSNVDVASLKAEFEYQYKKENRSSLRTKFFAHSTKINKMGAKFPRLYNKLIKATGGIAKASLGIARERSLPLISVFKNPVAGLITYTKQDKRREHLKVLLYIDEFTEYLDGNIASDALLLLTKLGYQVSVIKSLESGRSYISKGFLKQAKKTGTHTLNTLAKHCDENTVVLGIEPSALLMFRDEYTRLLDDDLSVQFLSERSFLIEEFIASEFKKGFIDSSTFKDEHKKIKIHLHCHQKALGDKSATFTMLNIPENYKPTIIPSGCCGMAGSFGYEKEHFDISMKIGEQTLFPAIRKASRGVIIAANGTSCRHQIKDGTGRQSLHPVTILKDALI